jgi:hypothetical protein
VCLVNTYLGYSNLWYGAPWACSGWTFLIYAYRARRFGNDTPWWYAMLRSASTTLAGGGIEWRETRHPLKELKDNVI